MKNMNEPMVGGQYEWQGMPCAISKVETLPWTRLEISTLTHYKHLVTVEYFNKTAKQWAKLKTPFDGTFQLVLAPRVST